MENYYKYIDGWFDFPEFYDFIVNKFDNAVFVEIGTWKGKSIMYMAEKIKELNKNIKLYGIDTFEGSESTPGMGDLAEMKAISETLLYETYLKNIGPLKKYIITIKGNSHIVHDQFENESVDFVFIDADHFYEPIKKDIELWYPKIKNGGIIAGHDYTDQMQFGVVQAVNEFFKDDFERSGDYVWFHTKKKEFTVINERGYYNDDREKGGINEPTIVTSLIKLFDIKTAVDIGCGNGSYTKQFIQNKIDCIGFDGCPFTPVITDGTGLVLDFSKPVDIGKFDMVLSLEVGEHIPEEYADTYLDNLCTAAKNYICLSWSPREDEVFGHCNCRKNDYVINEMTKRNFNFDQETTKYMREQVIAWNHFRDSLMFFKKV